MSKQPTSAARLGGFALAALSLAVTGALVSPPASASGFQISENTVQALGRAHAGREAAGDDASVVINNPAGMVDFDTYVLQVDATAINVSTKFHGGGVDAIGQPLTGGNGGNGGGVHGIPSVSFIAPIAPNWRLGFGIDAPFGLETNYNAGWVGRYEALKSSVKSMDIVGSVAWAVTPQFAVGFSLIGQKTTIDLGNAVNLGAVLASPPFNLAPTFLPQSADGTVRMRGNNWKMGWQVGFEWKPTSQDTLALSYHARINHHINGTAYFNNPQSVDFVLSQPGVPPLFQTTAGSGAFATPAIASLSYWHRTLGPISFGAELSWTGWKSFQNLAIDFANPAQPNIDQHYGWRNTLFGSVGMDYRLNEQWVLRTGIAYDQTPTRNFSRDPRIPDAARRWITVGAGYTPASNLMLNIGYAHLFVSNAGVNDVSSTGDVLAGYFKNSGDILGISMQYKF